MTSSVCAATVQSGPMALSKVPPNVPPLALVTVASAWSSELYLVSGSGR